MGQSKTVLAPYQILNRPPPKRRLRRKELVHGLCILMPVKDYDCAYMLAALKCYEQVSREKGNKVAVSWARHLQRKVRSYFGPLIRETKRERVRLEEIPALYADLAEFIHKAY